MSRGSEESGTSVGEVRSELRRLGYLDHQVERFLLQDALRRSPPWRALAQLSLKVGLLIGAPAAGVGALALAAANGHLRRSPFDLLPLAAHLLVPAVLALALAFLTLCGVLALVVRVTHARRIEALSFAFALVTAAVSVAVALWQGRIFAADLPTSVEAVLALAVPALAWAVFKVVHGGLLSLAIRLTEAVPEQPFAHGRWWVLLLILATFLVMLPAALDARHDDPSPPPFVPESAGDQVVVIGVDGVVPQELDFLVAAGELPSMARLLDSGGVLAAYARPPVEPITLWATVATGLAAAEHGLESLDTYRPLGVSRPLRRSGLLRHWWHLGSPGWVEYRPLLANERRAWAFWELASRGGAPALVVNWWGTFPVEATPGRLIAHGAYQLLAGEDGSEAAGVVHPPDLASELAARRGRVELPPGLVAGVEQAAGEEARRLFDQALEPDVFYRQEWRRGLRELEPRVAALYLPALDIAAAADLGSVVFSELVRWQLQDVDRLLDQTLAAAEDGPGTVVLVFDPGRRGAAEGRVMIWRRQGCRGSLDRPLEPAAITAAVLRALGLPQSRRLPPPPDLCPWPVPALEIDGFGPRRSRQPAVEGQEYLESLQSLGYL